MERIDMLIDAVRDYLDKNDWNYEFESAKNIIRCGVNLECKLQSVKVYVLFNENGFTVVVCPAMRAEESSRNAVMEFITRANYGVRNGNFEMDIRDGEVRYKIYINAKGMDSMPEEIVEDSIMIPVMMFEKYGNGLAAVMLGFSDAETEIKKIEG